MNASVVVAALLVQVFTAGIQAWLTSLPLDILGGTWIPWMIWLGMAATVFMAAALVWLNFRAERGYATVLSLFVIGSVVALAWPITFTFGIAVPEFVNDWAIGPALPTWQGLMTIAVGFGGAVRLFRRRPPQMERSGVPAPELVGQAGGGTSD